MQRYRAAHRRVDFYLSTEAATALDAALARYPGAKVPQVLDMLVVAGAKGLGLVL